MNASFLLRLGLTAAGAGIFYYVLMDMLPVQLRYTHFIYILFFFILATALFHYGLNRNSDGKKFIRFYMAGTAIKLFIYILIIIVHAVLFKNAALAFSLCFLLFYVVFSAFEMIAAYRQFGSVRKNSNSEPDNTLQRNRL
jgi:hypothetical protein